MPKDKNALNFLHREETSALKLDGNISDSFNMSFEKDNKASTKSLHYLLGRLQILKSLFSLLCLE